MKIDQKCKQIAGNNALFRFSYGTSHKIVSCTLFLTLVNNNTIVIDFSMDDIEINGAAFWPVFPRTEYSPPSFFLGLSVDNDDEGNTAITDPFD